MMIQQKLLKLAKRLNSFELDDIIIMSGEDEKEVVSNLESLVQTGQIKKNDNGKYFYLEKIIRNIPKKVEKIVPIEFKPREMFKPEDFFDPEKEKRDYEKYLKAPEYSRKRADKYLRILEDSRGLTGSKLQLFIKKWNLVYPDMKTSYSQVLKARKICIQSGKAALLAKYGIKISNKSSIEDKLYSKFLEIYLSPFSPRLSEAVEKLRKQEEIENPDNPYFPSPQSFMRRLKKEFTEREIHNFRNPAIKAFKSPPKANQENIAKNKPPKQEFTGDFKKAAELFLKGQYLKRIKPSTTMSYKGYIKNHLIPFFAEAKLPEINEVMINEFKMQKLDEGFSISSINSYLDILKIIVKTYSFDSKIIEDPKNWTGE